MAGVPNYDDNDFGSGSCEDQRDGFKSGPLGLQQSDYLQILSEGNFTCRPCAHCNNSNPDLITIVEDRSSGYESFSSHAESRSEACLMCTVCNQPYTSLTEDALPQADADEGSPAAYSGIECCRCHNKEPDCFEITRLEDGSLHKITCLVCGHGNTFHRFIPHEGNHQGRSFSASNNDVHDVDEISHQDNAIECIKCPNTTLELFKITEHPDGRIHKITCLVCGHGNTFHDTQSSQPGNGTGSVPRSRTMEVLKSGYSAAASLATAATPFWGIARNLIQRTASVGLNQATTQVQGNIQNRRPVAEGLRKVANGQLVLLGESLVVELGSEFFRRILPFVPDTAARTITRSLSNYVKQWANDQLNNGTAQGQTHSKQGQTKTDTNRDKTKNGGN